MEQDKKALFGNLAGIAITTGLAVVTQGSGQLILSVVNSIASNLASSFIEKAEYEKIKKIVGNYDPSELNHDLKKLIVNAVEWAIKNIGILYQKNLTDKQGARETKEVVKNLLENVRVYSGSFIQTDNEWLQLAEGAKKIDTSLSAFRINVESLPEINKHFPFPEFFRQQFVPNLKLCFGELLKSPRNRPAYIAYQREIYNDLSSRIDRLLLQNENIKDDLRKLENQGAPSPDVLQNVRAKMKSTSVKQREKYFDDALNEYLAPVRQQIELLVNVSEEIRDDVKEVKSITFSFDRKLRENWMSKHKVLVYFLVAAFILITAGLVYYINTRPFNARIFLQRDPALKIDPGYPPMSSQSRLIAGFPGGDQRFTLDANLQALLPEISSAVRNKKVKMKLEDPHWELSLDSVVMDKDVRVDIRPNANLARVHGIVRSWDGNNYIQGAKIEIYGDTIIYTDRNGRFDIELPIAHRKPEYKIIISAQGYNSIDESKYFPGNPIEFRMTKMN